MSRIFTELVPSMGKAGLQCGQDQLTARLNDDDRGESQKVI